MRYEAVALLLLTLPYTLALQTPKKTITSSEMKGLHSTGAVLDVMPASFTMKRGHIGTSIDTALTLVLNADYKPLSYMPLSIWHWQDSLRAVLTEKAYVVTEFEDLTIRSVSNMYFLPSVIVLKNYHSRPDQTPVMSRRNVYYRDNFCCQYCMENFERRQKDLSLDHVIPRSRGGKLTWLNTVTACNTCNFMKGHTLPEDLPRIGMKLRNQPRIPTYSELQYKAKVYSRSNIHPHWDHFL